MNAGDRSLERGRGSVTHETVLLFLREALGRLRGMGSGAFITVPAPRLETPEALWAVEPSGNASFWHQGDLTLVGLGAAVDFPLAEMHEGLRALQPAIDERLAELVIFRHPSAAAATPALIGGAAFARHGSEAPEWAAFGRGRLTLPRWTYRVDESSATLSLALVDETEFLAKGRWLEQLDTVLTRLAAPPMGVPSLPVVRQIDEMPRGDWNSLVERIVTGIGAGLFDKVVLARRSTLRLADTIDPTDLLRRLGARPAPAGRYRFGFRHDGCAFIGLTPEQLVAKQGLLLRSEALAGTIANSDDPSERLARAERLLTSRKDRGEHRVVVDELRRRLRPLASELDLPESPTLLELADVLHLWTPIRATLDQPTGLLALVDRLAPTASVGGHPSTAALEFLAEHEPDARGWYAGPVGWLDAEGNGEFAVAIRSALLAGDTAYVYAGAGIVRDSRPDDEFEETAAKQRSLLAALGLGG